MAFTTYEGISDAARGLQEFLFDREASIPDALREKLKALVGPTVSPVDAVVKGSELIYGCSDELEPKVLELGAALALVAQQYNFHGMAEEERGSRMALAMMRDAKVPVAKGLTYPKKEKDPEVKQEYKIQKEEPVDQSMP